MIPTNKLCDAADWFDPEIQEIIVNELREQPRFHRKQWESAMIFRALRAHGKLRQDSLGLSMGGGKELIAYAIAPHVHQLVITDLYEMNTGWDCAKTDDPDEFIRRNKPFPVDDERMKALRMDMRDLKFDDGTFDFCYSTCAVEHIGERGDFLRHFDEVARVLKGDGIYVFTTEMLFGEETIRDRNNYVFAISELQEILNESDLTPVSAFDATISQHKVNHPLPSTLQHLASFDSNGFASKMLQEQQHIQLLRGKHPFTAGIFVQRKNGHREHVHMSNTMNTIGLSTTKLDAEKGVKEYRSLLASSTVHINPFSFLPGESSRFFSDHSEFFSPDALHHDDGTLFHSDYYWWGNGRRVFEIALRVQHAGRNGAPEVEFRVHRYKTLASEMVECVLSETKPVQRIGWGVTTIEVETDEEYCYAILSKLRNGECAFDRIEIKSYLSADQSAAHKASEPRLAEVGL